jgi:AraC-like DNA-binding protein
VVFGYFDYRVKVELLGLKASDYLVFMPTSGKGQFRMDTCSRYTSTIEGFVANPGSTFDLLLEPDSPHLYLQMSAELLERELRKVLGRSLKQPLIFECGFDLSKPHSWRWHTAVQLLHEELYVQDWLSHNSYRIAALEEYLAATLILLQKSNYMDQLQPSLTSNHGSRVLRLAVKYMNENLGRDFSLIELADAVGVSVRSVQKAFQEEMRTAPMTYLRDLRLDRIRQEILASGDKMVKLSAIAKRWGMSHYGRFAIAYRQRFGETPSETLAKLG